MKNSDSSCQTVIVLPEKKDTPKKPWECELCGKKKMSVDIYCGGPFFKLCPECATIAEKAIDAYLRMMYYHPLQFFINAMKDYDSSEQSERK